MYKKSKTKVKGRRHKSKLELDAIEEKKSKAKDKTKKDLAYGHVTIKEDNPRKSSTGKPEGSMEGFPGSAAVEETKTEGELAQHLDYITFPNILGWYFDGYFDKVFGLNEKYAEYFNKLQAEYDEREDYEHEETFTEKVYRNFWPPKFRMGFFRTRGVYLDFPEVLADPPKTPPDINYEHKREPIGVYTGEDDDDENESSGFFGNTKRKKKKKGEEKEKEQEKPVRKLNEHETKLKALRKKMRKIPLELEDRPAWQDPSGVGPTKLREVENAYKNKTISWTSSDYTMCERRINLERPCRMDNWT